MKRIFVIILAICMLLTSCSPLPMIMSAESNSQEQLMICNNGFAKYKYIIVNSSHGVYSKRSL